MNAAKHMTSGKKKKNVLKVSADRQIKGRQGQGQSDIEFRQIGQEKSSSETIHEKKRNKMYKRGDGEG